MPFPPVEDQLAIIRRGIESIVPEKELAAKLKKSRETDTPLRIKYGIDPTGVDLHLGHTVPMRKMRQFQELGHRAVIVIGNYTALVGDPSGRDETRARLTAEQVEANAEDYFYQLKKVVDFDKAEVVRNGDWFGKMSFLDILNLFSKVTVAQLLVRDDFSKRMKAESPIYLHECLYPVMQAWDSVEVKADIELGGTEQLYSFMLARDLQKDQKQEPQIGVMSPILVGMDGVKRMGKSLGNYIGISEPPYEMMKKFMQIPDDVMKMYFELLTDLPLEEVRKILDGHPKDAKIALAKTVITEYHDAKAADESAVRWQNEIGGKELPRDIPSQVIYPDDAPLEGTTWSKKSQDGYPLIPAYELLVKAGLCKTKGEARRTIQQGGAYLTEQKSRIESFDEEICVEPGLLLWVGKKKVVHLELGDA